MSTAPRKRNAQPEHNLQTKIHQWVREHVPEPKFFCAFDRTRKMSMLQHVREKERGLVAGTPDTQLNLPGRPAIWVELKAYGKRVEADSNQERVGETIQKAGHIWGEADTVLGYATFLEGMGVSLQGNWRWHAEHMDALLTGPKEFSTKPKRTSRPRAAKPTQSQLKRVQALYARGLRF